MISLLSEEHVLSSNTPAHVVGNNSKLSNNSRNSFTPCTFRSQDPRLAPCNQGGEYNGEYNTSVIRTETFTQKGIDSI